MVGKALCFLGYLMFRVFLETDNPYQEKIESAKAQSTIQILTADWICSPLAGKSPTMSPLFSDQKKASARYFHHSITPSLHHSVTPALRSHSLSFCGGPTEADVGCKKKHAKKEHATRVPPQEEPRPTTAGYNVCWRIIS